MLATSVCFRRPSATARKSNDYLVFYFYYFAAGSLKEISYAKVYIGSSSYRSIQISNHRMGSTKKASEISSLLDLKPHPKAASMRRHLGTPPFPSPNPSSHLTVDRAVSTSIYFLLPSGNVSHLHRIPSAETWHFYMGEPLTVFELHDDGHMELTVLGSDLEAGHQPQYTVPPDVWFGSFPTLDVESFASNGSVLVKALKRDPELHYSLFGSTCSPGFHFNDFRLATSKDLKALAPCAEPFINYLTLANAS